MKNKLFVLQIVLICLFSFLSSCSKDENALLVKEESTNVNVKFKSAATTLTNGYSELEPNNTMATANGILSPCISKITGNISTSGDVDWYKIYCKNGYTISAASAGGRFLAFCDLNGNYVGSSSFTPNYTGICYLRVAGITAGYDVTITQSLPTESEGNNTISTANNVALNSCISGVASNGTSDIDCFVLTPNSNDAITFYLDGASGQVTAKIYNSNNELIETINKGMAITIPPLSSDKYYIQVQGSMPFSTYSVTYTLYVNPLYSNVNPIYFYSFMGDRVGLVDTYYKCSSSSFMNQTPLGMDGSFNYYSTTFFYYYNDSYPNTTCLVTGKYPNDFPIIRRSISVGGL